MFRIIVFITPPKFPLVKDLLLVTLLAVSVYYYHDSRKSSSTARHTVAPPVQSRAVANEIVVAPAPSSHDRWKTGPNAQVTFEPFLPNEQANWNPNPGYTIVSGYYRHR